MSLIKSQFSHTGNDIRYLVIFIHKRPNFDCELFMSGSNEDLNPMLPPHLQLSGSFYWFRNSICVVPGTHDAISSARRYLDNIHSDLFHEFILGKGVMRIGEVLDSDYTQTFIDKMVKEYHAYWPAFVKTLQVTDDQDAANAIYDPFYEKYQSGRSENQISAIKLEYT